MEDVKGKEILTAVEIESRQPEAVWTAWPSAESSYSSFHQVNYFSTAGPPAYCIDRSISLLAPSEQCWRGHKKKVIFLSFLKFNEDLGNKGMTLTNSDIAYVPVGLVCVCVCV